MSGVAALIQAIASLIWPLALIYLIWTLRHELPELVRRLRKASIGGQTVELDPQVRELENRLEAARSEQEALPQPPSSDDTIVERVTTKTSTILELAGRDKRLAVIAIATDLETSIRSLAGELGVANPFRTPLKALLDLLVRRGSLPESARSSLDVFWQVRDRVIHGGRPIDESELVTVIDIGLSLLNVVRAVPHETYRVVSLAPVYSDSTGTRPIPSVQGAILDVGTPSGVASQRRIYPTTRQYAPGARVTWAWNMDITFGEAWYLDPEDQQIKYAWTSSGEFVGEVIPDVPAMTG